MKEDWTKHIAKLAAEHRSKAPDGLVDDVRKEMARRGLHIDQTQQQPVVPGLASKPETQQKPTVPLWGYRRTAVAAAAVALAIAVPFTWKFLQHTSNTQTQIADSRLQHTADAQTQIADHRPHPAADAQGQLLPSAAMDAASVDAQGNADTGLQEQRVAKSGRQQLAAGIDEHQSIEVSEQPLTAMTETPPASSTSSSESSAVSSSESSAVSSASSKATGSSANAGSSVGSTSPVVNSKPQQQRPTTTYQRNPDPFDAYDVADNRSQGASFSLGAFYGAGGSSNLGGNALAMGYASDAVSEYSGMVLGYANEPLTVDAHHNMPIRGGLSVAYQLSSKWSVQMGLTYSYLASDITTTYINRTEETKQRLHYLGLPLTASYTVVGNDHWSAYLTAGGMAEKLVKGQRKNDATNSVSSVSEHRLQWAVKAAAGAAYRFTPQLSIYVEPGVSHYFDNHSGVVNVYKDRPTTFTLDMGVRVNVNK